jgi:hypothetical protein
VHPREEHPGEDEKSAEEVSMVERSAAIDERRAVLPLGSKNAPPKSMVGYCALR